MEGAWNQALRLAREGNRVEVGAAARARALSCREDLERKQRANNERRVEPDISHERLEQLAMYCERVPLGHYEGRGGLFEFVPILVNVVSVSALQCSVRARTDTRPPPTAVRSASEPGREGRRKAPAQLALHRIAMCELVLRAKALLCHTARLQHAPVEGSQLS